MNRGFTLEVWRDGRQQSSGVGGRAVTVNYVAVCRKWCGTFGKMQFGLLPADYKMQRGMLTWKVNCSKTGQGEEGDVNKEILFHTFQSPPPLQYLLANRMLTSSVAAWLFQSICSLVGCTVSISMHERVALRCVTCSRTKWCPIANYI